MHGAVVAACWLQDIQSNADRQLCPLQVSFAKLSCSTFIPASHPVAAGTDSSIPIITIRKTVTANRKWMDFCFVVKRTF